MILSASRRTDIPAFFADWFFARLKAGYVLVRNPMNPHQVASISLSRDVVDGIVFWTKNPIPMMDRLPLLADYPYYIQITITPYGTDIEPNVPSKENTILPAFRQLSGLLGPERVIWRYDPILLNDKYTIAYHTDAFSAMAKSLSGYTHQCTMSFIDTYRNTQKNAKALSLQPIGDPEMATVARMLAKTAKAYGIDVKACAEEADLSAYGISRAACVDHSLLERIGGVRLTLGKDKNQRTVCGCAASVDIGAYNTCANGCKYCYANYVEHTVQRNMALHDPTSPLLVGHVGPEDTVYHRAISSCADTQTSLF